MGKKVHILLIIDILIMVVSLKEKHNLSNTQDEQCTQFAVWKILVYVGAGLVIAERIHPYVDELVSLANKSDIGPYSSMEFKLTKSTLEYKSS